MRNLSEAKTSALSAYRTAKAEYVATVTRENIKGDFEKWKVFCSAKAECAKLGIRI